MYKENKDLYEFDKFRLDVSERFLLRNGKQVAITDRAFDTLCALVRRGNRLVSKDELMAEVWADAIVEENNLDKNISSLRRILGDRNGDKQKFIETVRGHGYRFVAEVRRVDLDTEAGRRSDTAMSDMPAADSESNAAKSQISNFKFQTGNYNGDKQPTSNDESPTKLQSPETEDQIENPQLPISNFKSNVVTLAAWRHEANDVTSQGTETEKATIVENQAASPSSEIDKSERSEPIESFPKVLAKSKSQRNRFVLAAIVSLVVLAGVGFGLYKFFTRPPIEFRAGKITRITSTGRAKLAAVSPDGKYLAHVQEEDAGQSLWVRQTATDGNVQIVPTAKTDYLSIEFSPDGNHLYYALQDFSLNQIPALGGAAKQLFDGANKSSPVKFSPDGKQIAFLRRSLENEMSVIIADADGSNERTLISRDSSVRLYPSFVWSPDGKVILCPFMIAGSIDVLAAQVANGNAVPILRRKSPSLRKIVWLPDSKSFLMIGSDARIYRVSYPSGEDPEITNDANTYTDISLSSDGHSLFAVRTEQRAHIWTMPSDDASRLRQITTAFDNYDGVNGLAWTPDGKIFYRSSPNQEDSIAWTIDTNGSNAKQLGEVGGSPALSPDGRYLVYQDSDTGGSEGVGLFRFDNSDGSEKRLTKGVGVWSAFSPDSKWIVFTRYADKISLCKVSIDGGEPIKLFDGSALMPAVSPDGKSIAFIGIKDKKWRISIIPFDGGEPVKTFDTKWQSYKGGKSPLQWTPDGRAINYLVMSDNVSNIWRQPIEGGAPVQVTNFTTDQIFNFAFSPDGSQLALSRGTFNSDVVLIENQHKNLQ
jgi:DNA-binding winged helix-turn-helix (wHTH) protein/Tol biopolymer transport system component